MSPLQSLSYGITSFTELQIASHYPGGQNLRTGSSRNPEQTTVNLKVHVASRLCSGLQ